MRGDSMYESVLFYRQIATPIYVATPTAVGFDAATTAWVAAVVSNGGTVSGARQIVVNSLIVGLKANGIWTKLDRLWLYAAENEPSALTDLIATALATKVSTPPFAVDLGYTGDDLVNSGAYINSNYNPVSNGIVFTQNSASVSGWLATNTASTQGGTILGANNASTYSGILASWTDGTIYGRVNDNPPSGNQGTPGTRAGHWIANRSGASASQIYQNGSLFSSPNQSSAALVSLNFFILCDNLSSVGSYSTSNRVAMTSIGGNLNGTDATNFYNAMLTYMIAVGVADSDADVTRWMVQARSNGGSVSIARRNVVHNLITSLKADGIWTKLDRLWLFAAENTGSALTDIVAGGLATAVNTPTFAADLGYTGNASNMQIDSNFDPSSGSPQYVRDSACLFAWDNTGTSQTGAIVGRDGGANTRIIPISGANTFFAINQSQQITALGLGSYTGLWVANRTGANAATLDRNGTQVDTTASGSVGGITGDLTGLSDGASVYSDHQVCCMGMGSQLSGGERANLYTHLRTYMTAVGVP